MTNKPLPHNTEYEESLLCHLILYKNQRQEVFEVLKPTEFYLIKNQIIYQAMLELDDIDLVSIIGKLKEQGKAEKATAVYVASLTDIPASVSPVKTAIKIHELAVRRKLIETSLKIVRDAYECENVQKFIDESQAEINAISVGGLKDSFYHISELLPEAMERYENAIKNKSEVLCIGFEKLDRFIRLSGPLNIILAGRPSMGKTSMMKNFAIRLANQGHPVVIFSLEMSKEALIDSTISSATGLSQVQLYNKLDRVDWDKLGAESEKLHTIPLYIDDDYRAKDIYELKRRARIAVKKLGAKIVFIDQISKIKGIDGVKKTEEMSKYSNIIADIVKELAVPVVTLSQLNRDVEKRTGCRPILSDLKQTGSLEEDADAVLLLYRPFYYTNKPEDEGKAELIIAKQRMGPVGVIEMVWDKKRMEFNEKHEF